MHMHGATLTGVILSKYYTNQHILHPGYWEGKTSTSVSFAGKSPPPQSLAPLTSTGQILGLDFLKDKHFPVAFRTKLLVYKHVIDNHNPPFGTHISGTLSQVIS